MPTILDLYTHSSKLNLDDAAQLLSKARQRGRVDDIELQRLASLINNSLVGASKLLHFIAPSEFAIWDSKVYAFVFGQRAHQYRMSDITKYRHYHDILELLRKDNRFERFHNSINSKMGYIVSPIRALEVVMYLNAPDVA
jgi:hypothetical protein